jgi:hypothetical protein
MTETREVRMAKAALDVLNQLTHDSDVRRGYRFRGNVSGNDVDRLRDLARETLGL